MPDYLATIDVDEASPTYGQVIKADCMFEVGVESHDRFYVNPFAISSAAALLHKATGR